MTVLKAGKNVIGAKLTNAEQKAMEIEIMKQLAIFDKENAEEIDAMVLWILRSTFGFGEQKLRRFHDAFGPCIDALVARYELGATDEAWLCKKKLKDDGIDISEWNKIEVNE